MDKKTSLKKRIMDLLVKQSLAVLATNLDDSPYTSLVGFITDNDNKDIYFATLNNATKYKNIVNNSSVSLLIDSRTNSYTDFTSSSALTVIGKMTSIVTEKKDPVFINYLAKYPQLKEFVDDPLCVLIKIQVSKYLLVEKFKEVETYEL